MIGVALVVQGSVDPERRLAGLTLVLRAVLELQKRGAERIVVIAPEDAALPSLTDPRVTVPLERAAALDAPTDAFVFARHDLVVDPAASLEVSTPTLDTLSSWRPANAWSVEVNDDDGRREATRLLFEACRKSVDGIVSRHLNRHVSLTLSRWLVDTPVTPNAMTIATFAVGLVATWLVLDASYATTAAAGVLMQLNSILDGCDGELARVRHQGSKLGQWLDTVGDDLSNVLFWTALGFGARVIDPEGVWMAPAAWITAAANGLAALLNYALLARKGSGDFYALREDELTEARAFTKVASFLANTVLKQDFFLLFVMLVALAGVLHWVTPLLALAAVLTLGGAVVRVWRAAATRKAGIR
jgi:phosphatidylglycerophosphate synthase